MNFILWSLYKLGPIEVISLYGALLCASVYFASKAIKKRRRRECLFFALSIIMAISFHMTLRYSFDYTERESTETVELIVSGEQPKEPIAWYGERFSGAEENAQVSVVDEFWGRLDVRADLQSGDEWNFEVSKNWGEWSIYAQRN